MITLRPYQQKMIEQARALLLAGERRILLVSPTGSGKGSLCAFMINGLVRNNKRAMFIVNRRELVKDMSRRVEALGLDYGVIMGDSPRYAPWKPVQVASIDTLRNRQRPPAADVIFADEAHFSVSDSWEGVLEKYPGAAVIGMTATPIRGDGQGLGKHFKHLVLGPTVRELIELGFLVPTRVYAPSRPDLAGVAKSAGDYNQKQLGERMNKPGLTGDIVSHWKQLGQGKPTVCFAVNVEHSREICKQFAAAGIEFRHVDANTPDEERDRAWEQLRTGRLPGVSSVGVVSYGWDLPACSVAILARPTMSEGLYLQQVGRVLRPYPGKDAAIILDHAGNTLMHGFAEDERVWTLDGIDRKSRGEKEDDGPSIRRCEKCWYVYPASQDACPAVIGYTEGGAPIVCGEPYKSKAKPIKTREGTLQEVRKEFWYKCDNCNHKGRLPEGVAYEDGVCARCETGPVMPLGSRYDAGQDEAGRREKYLAWKAEAEMRGYKPGWPKVRFKQTFGKWPPGAWDREAVSAGVFADLGGAEEGGLFGH